MKEKLIKELVDKLAEENNTIDLGTYEKGLRDMYTKINMLINFDWFEVNNENDDYVLKP